jgi:hypothetical protein
MATAEYAPLSSFHRNPATAFLASAASTTLRAISIVPIDCRTAIRHLPNFGRVGQTKLGADLHSSGTGHWGQFIRSSPREPVRRHVRRRSFEAVEAVMVLDLRRPRGKKTDSRGLHVSQSLIEATIRGRTLTPRAGSFKSRSRGWSLRS